MRSLTAYLSYYRRVLRRAWSETWTFTKQQGLLAGTIAAALGSMVYWLIEDQVDVVPILVGSVGGLVVVIGAWLALQLLLAPARIDRDRQKELTDQAEQYTKFLGHKAGIQRMYGSNIVHLPSLPAASRQIGTELREIRHKIEMVRATRPTPHYSHAFRLPGARWDEYDELLAGEPELYPLVERAYVAAHHVNKALEMRETRARPGQTIGVTPDDGLNQAYEAAGEALDALGETRGDPWESEASRAAREVTDGVMRELSADNTTP